MIRIAVTLAAIGLAFPVLAQELVGGAVIFEKRCSRCHASAARILRKLPNEPEARRATLSSLLGSHHAAVETERAQLIDWLLAQ